MEQSTLRKRILLVDDDPITNMINEKLITRDFDFQVSPYTNASDALDHLKELSSPATGVIPSLVLLDINMPVMDGWEFLEKFSALPQTLFSKCRVFMLTSSIDLDDIEKSKTYAPVRGFISKPLTTAKIKLLTTEPSATI